MCLHKARELRYKFPYISHVVADLILNLKFFTEDPYLVGDTVNIFLFPNPPASIGLEAALLARRWNTALDSSKLTMYSDTASLLQHKNVAPIVGWEAVVSMLENWDVS